MWHEPTLFIRALKAFTRKKICRRRGVLSSSLRKKWHFKQWFFFLVYTESGFRPDPAETANRMKASRFFERHLVLYFQGSWRCIILRCKLWCGNFSIYLLRLRLVGSGHLVHGCGLDLWIATPQEGQERWLHHLLTASSFRFSVPSNLNNQIKTVFVHV